MWQFYNCKSMEVFLPFKKTWQTSRPTYYPTEKYSDKRGPKENYTSNFKRHTLKSIILERKEIQYTTTRVSLAWITMLIMMLKISTLTSNGQFEQTELNIKTSRRKNHPTLITLSTLGVFVSTSVKFKCSYPQT